VALGAARAAPLAAAGAYAVLVAWQLAEPLACAGTCFVDHAQLYGEFAPLARNDTRLNAWALAWVQRSLLADPLRLFDANAFHPAQGVLAGSEHLIGLAVQMLPARAFTANALAIHQLALALSAWILGLSTFALVRWLVRPAWVALAAGAAAIAMPWRSLELMHVQLLSAHWIPLLWLLVSRLLAGEARSREAWLFAAILALELLSSYYVAYLAAVSLGALALALAAQGRVRIRGLACLALAALPGLALLAAVSLPYLARERRGEIPSLEAAGGEGGQVGAAFAAEAWRAIAPRFAGGVDALAGGYAIPATIAGLALLACGLVLAPVRRRASDPQRDRERAIALALACVCAVCGLLMLGSEVQLGGVSIELPGGIAARLLPGFASLRAPLRWAIPIALAAPVLAGVGLARADGLARERLGRRAGRALVALPALALLALDLRPRALGAEPAWRDPEELRALAGALAALPPGPLLEAPWRADLPQLQASESEALLASTLHWRPILNGFTAYPPPSYAFLLRAARGLPDAAALERLAQLTGLRWIALHRERLAPAERALWDAALAQGRLREAWSGQRTSILELAPGAGAGALATAVADPAPDRTLGGIARSPLELDPPAGSISLASPSPRIELRGIAVPLPLELSIENRSARDWPGSDASPEGLVLLRYAFSDPDGSLAASGTAPLDLDVPAGATLRATPLVTPPPRLGRFRLCLDLVQRIGSALRPLPVARVASEVEITGAAPSPGAQSARLARYAGWLAGAPEVASDPCAD
jgi:hypothetical protein